MNYKGRAALWFTGGMLLAVAIAANGSMLYTDNHFFGRVGGTIFTFILFILFAFAIYCLINFVFTTIDGGDEE